MMNIPNMLTLFRVLLVPVLVIVYYLPFTWSFIVAAFIFWLAAITDWFDGYLARKLNQTTPFGAFFDPVADKVMVAVSLCLLIEHFQSWWMTIPAMVIIGREVVISALREWMAELGKRTNVAVSIIGKIKTVVQMLAVIMLLLLPAYSSPVLTICAIIFLYFSVVLTLYSMYIYMVIAWADLSPFKPEC